MTMAEADVSPKRDSEPKTEILLAQVRAGDQAAETLLMDRIYQEVRRLARYRLARKKGISVEPTELANAALVRLLKREQRLGAQDRAHLMSMIGEAMRHELLDRARRVDTIKRGRGEIRVPLDPEKLLGLKHSWRAEELIALDDCLTQLREMHPRWVAVVEHRFFGGLTWEQVVEITGVENASVAQREYDNAKLWLYQALGGVDK
jgi:RNA polymerase sigma factor (TIGR02999 family)